MDEAIEILEKRLDHMVHEIESCGHHRARRTLQERHDVLADAVLLLRRTKDRRATAAQLNLPIEEDDE